MSFLKKSKDAIRQFLAANPHAEYSSRQIRQGSGIFWNLYAALYRMEEDGEIIGRWANGPYPRRRLYRLAQACPVPVDKP